MSYGAHTVVALFGSGTRTHTHTHVSTHVPIAHGAGSDTFGTSNNSRIHAMIRFEGPFMFRLAAAGQVGEEADCNSAESPQRKLAVGLTKLDFSLFLLLLLEGTSVSVDGREHSSF